MTHCADATMMIVIDEDDGAYYQPSRHRALDACFYAAGRVHAYSTATVRHTGPACVNSRGGPPPLLPLPSHLPSQHP